MLFLHYYGKAYAKSARWLGRQFANPPWTKPNPLVEVTKSHFTALVTATFTADMHGIPYEFYVDKAIELHTRYGTKPPVPGQLYITGTVEKIIEAWNERNVSGIYTAKAPQLHVSAYERHPVQDAYMNFLCHAVTSKGNKAFYLARLMFDIGHLTEAHATAAFGSAVVARAHDHK